MSIENPFPLGDSKTTSYQAVTQIIVTMQAAANMSRHYEFKSSMKIKARPARGLWLP